VVEVLVARHHRGGAEQVGLEHPPIPAETAASTLLVANQLLCHMPPCQ
jgi:hypothetical protein